MNAPEERRRRVFVRKRRRFASHNRIGVWKLAYADFVTAMMAFFMVMWLLSQADLKLRSQVALYFRSPGILPGGAAINEELNSSRGHEMRVVADELVLLHGEGEQQAFDGRKRDIERAVQQDAAEQPELAAIAGQVRVNVAPEGLTIEVVDQAKAMLFDVSSAELKPQVVELLRRIAPALGALSNPIQVGGHTDGRPFPTSSPISNWNLAFARADAARRVLESSGLRPGQIERVLSFADSQPLVPGNPLADENRRLTILAVRQYVVPTERPRGGP